MKIKDIINKGLANGTPENIIAEDCVNKLGVSLKDALNAIEIYKYLLP